ncbi:MAG: carboxymuconolactone decarboxylase family protein, partial [Oribacterium sp.]|nr:carboxymuconolactone decarboxylase family protein [Oribacterium sp.]
SIPRKYRELIVMAIGMATGTETTIKIHSKLALENGATLDELTEVIRIVFFTCGVTKLLPTLEILSDILEPISYED